MDREWRELEAIFREIDKSLAVTSTPSALSFRCNEKLEAVTFRAGAESTRFRASCQSAGRLLLSHPDCPPECRAIEDDQYRWAEFLICKSTCEMIEGTESNGLTMVYGNAWDVAKTSADLCFELAVSNRLVTTDSSTESVVVSPTVVKQGDDGMVELHEVSPPWNERFPTVQKCTTWLNKNSAEVRNESRGRRRFVHAAQWMRHWAAVDKAASESLSTSEPKELTTVDVAFVEGAAQRLEAIRRKRK